MNLNELIDEVLSKKCSVANFSNQSVRFRFERSEAFLGFVAEGRRC